MTVTIRLTVPGHPLFAEAAELLDEDRQYYGEPRPGCGRRGDPGPGDQRPDAGYVAGPGTRVDGICTVAVIPAALTLRTVWLLRDLYVHADARRGAVARALLAHVADAARSEGAHRLSLQTEAGNAGALELYARAGFQPVGDVALLHRFL